jgi:hypothetical protein
VEITFSNEQILIDGSSVKNPLFLLDTIPQQQLITPKESKHMMLNVNKLPDTLSYYTQKLFTNLALPQNNQIQSQQLIWYGIDLVNIDKKLIVLPLIDAIIRYEQPLPFNPEKTLMDTLNIGSRTYYKKQISSTEYYIGTSHSPIITKNTSNASFSISGNPSVIFNIEGKGILSQLIQILPFFQSSKLFFEEFQTFEINSQILDEKGNIKLSGSIQFKDEQIASIELLKFLLNLYN